MAFRALYVWNLIRFNENPGEVPDLPEDHGGSSLKRDPALGRHQQGQGHGDVGAGVLLGICRGGNQLSDIEVRILGPVDDLVTTMRTKVPLDFQVSDCLLQVLAVRGVTGGRDLERFFYPSLDHLHDPFELQEMDRAVERTLQAVRDGERVAVHGDFDVDGITGSALLHETISALRSEGSRILPEDAFIPDRATDGYGVAERMVREWAARGVTLLILAPLLAHDPAKGRAVGKIEFLEIVVYRTHRSDTSY